LERELGIALPDDYRAFLLAHNGGDIEPRLYLTDGGPENSVIDGFFGPRDPIKTYNRLA
jgi:hypothetical protein